MLLKPGVEVKAVVADTAQANRDLGEQGSHFPVKAVTIHAQIGGCISVANHAVKGHFVSYSQ